MCLSIYHRFCLADVSLSAYLLQLPQIRAGALREPLACNQSERITWTTSAYNRRSILPSYIPTQNSRRFLWESASMDRRLTQRTPKFEGTNCGQSFQADILLFVSRLWGSVSGDARHQVGDTHRRREAVMLSKPIKCGDAYKGVGSETVGFSQTKSIPQRPCKCTVLLRPIVHVTCNAKV